jgi:hypothetical protein
MTGMDNGAPASSPQTSQTPPRWHGWRDATVRALHDSWLFTADPVAGADVWEESKVDTSRIPKGRGAHTLEILWQFSNWTDRLPFYAVIWALGWLPDRPWTRWVDGPTRYIFIRPTRRWTFYLLTVISAAWLNGVL